MYTLGCVGRKNSKSSIGSHGHVGDTSPAQTCETPKDLSTHESEEHGRGESMGWYPVFIRERGGCGRGGCGIRRVNRCLL
jgi:hypothetical protein